MTPDALPAENPPADAPAPPAPPPWRAWLAPLLLVAGLACTAGFLHAAWTTPAGVAAAWPGITKGLTRAEVSRRLGRPVSVGRGWSRGQLVERWTFHQRRRGQTVPDRYTAFFSLAGEVVRTAGPDDPPGAVRLSATPFGLGWGLELPGWDGPADEDELD